MSRTDAIIAAVLADLESRRASIDTDETLRNIKITVHLYPIDHEEGPVRALLFLPESERVFRLVPPGSGQAS